MASSIDARTIVRSIDFSRATASTICNSSSRLALTAIIFSFVRPEQLWSRAAGRGFGFVCLTLGGLSAVPRLALRSSLRVLERRLLAPERGADEIVGQDEPRLGHRADRQFDLARAPVVGDQRHLRRW